MKISKKIISLILAVILLIPISLLSSTVFAAPANAKFALTASEVKNGKFTVVLSLQNCLGFTSSDVTLGYDSAVLEFVPYTQNDAQQCESLADATAFEDTNNHFFGIGNAKSEKGKVKIGFYYSDCLDAEKWGVDVDMSDVKLLRMTFKVLDSSADTKLTLDGNANFFDNSRIIVKEEITVNLIDEPTENTTTPSETTTEPESSTTPSDTTANETIFLRAGELINGKIKIQAVAKKYAGLEVGDWNLTYDSSALKLSDTGRKNPCDGTGLADDYINTAISEYDLLTAYNAGETGNIQIGFSFKESLGTNDETVLFTVEFDVTSGAKNVEVKFTKRNGAVISSLVLFEEKDEKENTTLPDSSIIISDEISGGTSNINTVSDLITATDGKTQIISADGKAVASNATLSSGMKIILKDSNGKTVDEKTVVVPGDVDGKDGVAAADARMALRASVGLEKLNSWATNAANIDKNSKIEASDARTILRISVSLEKKLSAYIVK